MNHNIINSTKIHQEEWLKVLGKGMVTLPKKWRDELGISTGSMVRAKKQGNQVVIEPSKPKQAPYRVYSDEEIEEFVKNDELPPTLAQKVDIQLGT